MQRLLSLFLLLFSIWTWAQPVDKEKARSVGSAFLNAERSSTSGRTKGLELVYISDNGQSQGRTNATSDTYFYVFNSTATPGFVVVSGQQNLTPILAYSRESNFDPQHIPDNVAYWLEGYKSEALVATEHKVPATDDIRSAWAALENGKWKVPPTANQTTAVNPLVQTRWDQSPFYNAQCPFDVGSNSLTVTGCVATAMAQIMKFWNYPPSGAGFHSYNHSTYGTQSANFGSTTYQWSSMPNTVTSANIAVATLMYHCGVSVDMEYGPAVTGGSGAFTSKVVTALKDYFRYQSTVQEKLRAGHTETAWKNLIKTELDAGRPIEYSGLGGGGGHSFVCDGYDNNDFFHFNWGWGGNSDGYFTVNALNPAALGSGGGTGGFNSEQAIIIGIQPPPGSVVAAYDMRLNSAISISPSPIIYEQGFSVTVDLRNFGTSALNNFTGVYTAAVFNSNEEFVGYVEIKDGSLAFGNQTNPLVFTTTGMETMTPGTYKIGIYYKPTGATQWVAFANGNFQNFITVEVETTGGNPLILYSPITTSPQAVIQNQSLSINFDVANDGTTPFNGDISIDIHKSDGTWIRELSKKTGLSLPAGFHYTGGLTYEVPSGLAEAPGTYQLFAWSFTGGEWEVLTSGDYSNPVSVNVLAPALPEDIYESNNTVAQAYNIPVSIPGTSVNITTSGASCHTGTDYDYYKFTLPAGTRYTISPRLHDANNSANGNTYTLNAILSVSVDGSQWAGPYDYIPNAAFESADGGTYYFHVAPAFSGEKGTYLLDIGVVKNSCAQVTTTAIAATDVTPSSFKANWTAVAGATGYQVDVSSNSFSTFLPDYNSKAVEGGATTSVTVTDLTPAAAYSYRVRVVGTCVSINSNSINAVTTVRQTQAITFTTPADKTMGTGAFNLAATATSTLPIAFTTTSATITISGSTATMVKAGRTSVTASQAGNESFFPATPVTRSFCVKPAKPVITIGGSDPSSPVLTSSATEGNVWYKDGSAVPGATLNTFTVTVPGVYKVQAKVDDCISEFSTDFPVIVTGNTNGAGEIAMFPNPADNYIYIAGLTSARTAQLIDMTGRSATLSLEAYGGHARADVHDLSRGLYILTVIEGATVHQFRFTRK